MAPPRAPLCTRIVDNHTILLDYRAAFDWRREGLHCAMTIPRSDRVEERKFAGPAKPGKEHGVAIPKAVNGNRILLVEDEALVAMMMRDSLVELGFSVVGPFDRAADALACAPDELLDAAILDVNLGGDLVYPVAERLARRVCLYPPRTAPENRLGMFRSAAPRRARRRSCNLVVSDRGSGHAASATDAATESGRKDNLRVTYPTQLA